jgi:hypothetical protein
VERVTYSFKYTNMHLSVVSCCVIQYSLFLTENILSKTFIAKHNFDVYGSTASFVTKKNILGSTGLCLLDNHHCQEECLKTVA